MKNIVNFATLSNSSSGQNVMNLADISVEKSCKKVFSLCKIFNILQLCPVVAVAIGYISVKNCSIFFCENFSKFCNSVQ